MPNQMIIAVTGVSKRHGSKEIIRGIDFTIERGSFVAIMGPSGAGKTTFMNILSGLEPCTGKVVVDNKDIGMLKEPKLTKFRRQTMSYIFQDYNLIDFLTVRENILVPLKITKHKVDKKLYVDTLTKTGLIEHERKKPTQLSGGQKQRVAIVRSIVSECPIIFADEPTGALDLRTRDQVMDILSSLVRQFKRTLVLVTHDPLVASYADRTVFLVDGQIKHEIGKTSSLAIAEIIDDLEKRSV